VFCLILWRIVCTGCERVRAEWQRMKGINVKVSPHVACACH
jgi:predicted Fe-S protein YdhL (DUF1289 family)